MDRFYGDKNLTLVRQLASADTVEPERRELFSLLASEYAQFVEQKHGEGTGLSVDVPATSDLGSQTRSIPEVLFSPES
jgi:hypothetical protein